MPGAGCASLCPLARERLGEFALDSPTSFGARTGSDPPLCCSRVATCVAEALNNHWQPLNVPSKQIYCPYHLLHATSHDVRNGRAKQHILQQSLHSHRQFSARVLRQHTFEGIVDFLMDAWICTVPGKSCTLVYQCPPGMLPSCVRTSPLCTPWKWRPHLAFVAAASLLQGAVAINASKHAISHTSGTVTRNAKTGADRS